MYNQESYYDAIKNVLPEDKEIWDDQLLGELKSFSDLLVEKICIANYKRKVDFKFSALMKKKIDDVKKMFGEPKLTTPSYWDGYAYTFYGKDYSDYLYLETDSDGKIVCYGSVSPGFETN